MKYTFVCGMFLLAGVFALSCSNGNNEKPEESPSEGSLTIYCDEYTMPLMQKEVAVYDSIYPHVSLTLVPTNSRDAVVQLLSGKSKLIILGRAFSDEERQLIEKYKIQVGEYEIGKDAMAVIVNRQNPLDSISIPALKELMLKSNVTPATSISWTSYGVHYNQPVTTVVPSPTSSVYGYVTGQITAEPLKSANIVCDSASQVVSAVRRNGGAIGFMDWDCVSSDTTVKILRVSAIDSTGNTGGAVLLHPAYIYLKKYPLLHSVWGYTTEGKPALAKGLLAFICNAAGQRIVLDQKLVPTTQIIRLKEPE